MGIAVDQKLNLWTVGEVEVCYKEKGPVCYDEIEKDFRGVWYKAIIEKKTPPTIRSVRLLKDDFATPLAEFSEKAFFRPVPPANLQARVHISEGCVVDAYYKDAWWSGLLIKEIEDDKCLVFFDSPPDIIQFEKNHLRPHLDWVKQRTWIIPHFKLKFLRRLTEESIFSSGTMVEVSSVDNMEVVWVPAMVIKEIEDDEEDDKKKYIVKFSNDKANLTVDSKSVRPTQPPFSVEDYKFLDCVEAFSGSSWRKGIVKRIISQKSYIVSFKAIKKQLRFSHSDLRPPVEWEDGFWKTKESPLAQGSGNRISDSVMNGDTPSLANESFSPVTPLKQADAVTQGKVPQPERNENGLANDSTRENESSEDNNRRRKREENFTSAADVVEETTKANNAAMVPFVKTFPIWKTLESVELPRIAKMEMVVYMNKNEEKENVEVEDVDQETMRKNEEEEEEEEEENVEAEDVDPETKFQRLKAYVASLQAKPETPPDWLLADRLLPPRIFVRDYYPIGARVNGYSKPEIIAEIARALKDSQEMVDLMNTQFGRLFEIPAKRLAFSGKIVHNLLSRQLWTKKPHELWFVFGGQPIRFSLREFWILTGLECGQFPDARKTEQKKSIQGLKKTYLEEITGKKKAVKISELLTMLKNNTKWPSWKKFRVALILIVDGVVAVRSQNGLVSPNTVEMCRDVDFFLRYPWGRESFNLTIDDIVPDKSEESLKYTIARQKQQSISIHGFPLAIQLLAYASISGLDHIRRDPGDDVDFTQRSTQELLRKNSITDYDIITCELDSKLHVETIIQTSEEVDPVTISWEDEEEDAKLDHVFEQLKLETRFSVHDWPGGDFTCPRVLTTSERNAVKEYEAAVKRRAEEQGAKDERKRKRKTVESETKRAGKRRRMKTEIPAGCLDDIKGVVRGEITAFLKKRMKSFIRKEIQAVVKVEVKAAITELIRSGSLQIPGNAKNTTRSKKAKTKLDTDEVHVSEAEAEEEDYVKEQGK